MDSPNTTATRSSKTLQKIQIMQFNSLMQMHYQINIQKM